MNRHQLPPAAAAPDLPAQITEIRLPQRSTGHALRNREGARA